MSVLIDTIDDVRNQLLHLGKYGVNKECSKIFDYSLLTKSFGELLPEGFQFGTFIKNDGQEIPAFLPLNNSSGICFSISEISNFALFNELLEASVFQIIDKIKSAQLRISLIDGKNFGLYFSHFTQLHDSITGGKVLKDNNEIFNGLNEILNESYEFYRFIIINNFPQGFTNESIALLIKIISQKGKDKIKLFITKENNPPQSIADLDASLTSKIECFKVDKEGKWASDTFSKIPNFNTNFNISVRSFFTSENIEKCISRINKNTLMSEKISSVVFDINDGIRIPFGKNNNSTFYFRLGHGESNYHAIIGGRSGKGKTVFLDNLITKATLHYSPDELRFVLIDMKGIEFFEYKKHPFVASLCSSTDIDKALKVIDYLKAELKSRELLFSHSEAKNIVEYKRKTREVMPRLLVIIDEFQNLFTNNYKLDEYIEEVLIKQILRLGRAFGIHLVCCTQSLGDGVRSSFLNNIPLRIAFQMTQDQSRSFLSNNNPAAERLKVGEVIYNEQDGLLSENVFVKVDNISSEEIQAIINQFNSKGLIYKVFDKLIV